MPIEIQKELISGIQTEDICIFSNNSKTDEVIIFKKENGERHILKLKNLIPEKSMSFSQIRHLYPDLTRIKVNNTIIQKAIFHERQHQKNEKIAEGICHLLMILSAATIFIILMVNFDLNGKGGIKYYLFDTLASIAISFIAYLLTGFLLFWIVSPIEELLNSMNEKKIQAIYQ